METAWILKPFLIKNHSVLSLFYCLNYIFIITIIDNRPIVMFLYMLSAKAYTCGGFSYVACKFFWYCVIINLYVKSFLTAP